ncbi:putative ATP-dependent RNA helicase TDRD12 [Gymnodraco acuticeps]|uniref:RNA helicase n=1 Tax=Gymnodraco acuticeps TaxID=8218 RepID=A0A6P8UYH2_GYMAC|nr:putative ATP-dependent RNA helicase TDRD12 [Gymnodraco acuticeps]
MLEISIVKVESPSCLWGRAGRGGQADQYDGLLAEMNLFYHDVTQDLRKLTPTSLEEGQVCVVYWAVIKSWCRVLVESIVTDSVSCQARCLLVDHGERLVVPSDQIRIAMQNFLQLPFWVKRFHLAGIKPTTLRVCVHEIKAGLIASTRWDSSSTLYMHSLLQASTRTEAVLLESEADSTSIELYLTVGSIKICLNDDLVAKKFAYYSRESADRREMDEEDQLPVMLSSSILTQTASSKPKSPIAISSGLTAPQVSSSAHGVSASPLDNSHASSPLTSLRLQSQQHELQPREEGSGSKVTEEHLSEKGPDAAAAPAESDSSEDTDSSLAAALTKDLSLFRFLKFLNPGSIFQQASPTVSEHEEQKETRPEETTAASSTEKEVLTPSNCEPETLHKHTLTSMSEKSGAEGLCESSQVERIEDEGTSRWSRSEEKRWKSETDWACSRLLEWLNPEPVNPDFETAHDAFVPSDPRRSGILVHSFLPVEPCSSLDDAPITDSLRWVLKKRQCSVLTPAERYSWPSVARGCNTVIISPSAEQPLSYIAPLLTHILLNSIYTALTSSAGPMAVLLCPGWEKVMVMMELLEEMKLKSVLHPYTLLLGVGKDEAKAVRIPKNCLLLVTTPFSLVRLLSVHCFLFLRLYHLVLDEADQLFTLAPDQMATILQHFQKVTSSEEKTSCPQQLVAVAKRWTNHIEALLANHMPYPCIVMAIPEEAALYGNVQQIIRMTVENDKISVLLDSLDFNSDVGQKTLIVAKSAQEVEDVFKAVSNKSAFCLKTHEGLTHQFDFVVQQWRKDIGPGTHVILVTSSECLKCLGIRDATCVVHYGFPASPKVFGSRLFCMAEHFRNLSDRDQTGSPRLTRSVLLISERNACHVVGVLRYLERANAPLPPELLDFVRGVNTAREEQKTHQPLCGYVKSYGVCRDSSVCPDRHTFVSELDQSVLPASGVIEVVPLYIKTASVYYGRIVRKEDGGFQNMASEMKDFYADKKPGVEEILEGGLFAVQEDNFYHRVKVLSVPDRGDRLFFTVFVRFIDVGKEKEVKSHQILKLPERFHSLPGQAVEIIVCRVKPVDAETDWHPKVTRAISQKIRGLQHRAKAVFSLGNTVFVDPMVRMTQVPGMKTVINEYTVQSEILSSGMAVSNPEHLELLKALCISGSGNGSVSLEVRIKAEQEALAEAVRAAELADLPQLEPCEPLSPDSSTIQSLVPVTPVLDLHLAPASDQRPLMVSQSAAGQRNTHSADLRIRIEDGEVHPMISKSVLMECRQNGVSTGEDESSSQQLISSIETRCGDAVKSFHPLARWYQTSDSLIVTMKLKEPQNQSCQFFQDRVVYSGRVNERTYRADLQLHANIAPDRCCWEMKSNEPVLKLFKQQPGHWEKLLRNKNIFVSYDVEHIEFENEDRTPNGVCFQENMGGNNNSYVVSESGSESD